MRKMNSKFAQRSHGGTRDMHGCGMAQRASRVGAGAGREAGREAEPTVRADKDPGKAIRLQTSGKNAGRPLDPIRPRPGEGRSALIFWGCLGIKEVSVKTVRRSVNTSPGQWLPPIGFTSWSLSPRI